MLKQDTAEQQLDLPQTLRLVDKGTFLFLGEQLPFGTCNRDIELYIIGKVVNPLDTLRWALEAVVKIYGNTMKRSHDNLL